MSHFFFSEGRERGRKSLRRLLLVPYGARSVGGVMNVSLSRQERGGEKGKRFTPLYFGSKSTKKERNSCGNAWML